MKKPWAAFYDQSAIYIGEREYKPDMVQEVSISNQTELHDFLKEYLPHDKREDIFIYGYGMELMLEDFILYFRFIKAAGGLVRNLEGKYLFIKRFGIWDLPKGKIKKKEEPATGACREVTEETGVLDLKIISQLPSTYHIYPLKGKTILKRTYWYLMDTGFDGKTKPQTEEDITEVHWLNPADARKAIHKSYRSIEDTLHTFIRN